ncbi:MAG: hypothetical protein QXV30_00980 [Desulfurococcaceae archaeon]
MGKIKYLLPFVYTCYNKFFGSAEKLTALNCVEFMLHEYLLKEFGPIFAIMLIEGLPHYSISILDIVPKNFYFSIFTITLLLIYELGYLINDLAAKIEPQEMKVDRLETFGMNDIIFALLIRFLVVVIGFHINPFYTLILLLIFPLHSLIQDRPFRASVTLPLLRATRLLWFIPLFTSDYCKSIVCVYAIASSIPYSIDYLLLKLKNRSVFSTNSKQDLIRHPIARMCFLYVCLSLLSSIIFNVKIDLKFHTIQNSLPSDLLYTVLPHEKDI